MRLDDRWFGMIAPKGQTFGVGARPNLYPAGQIFGMPVMIDPSMPNDRIRFVNPVTGRYDDYPIPPDPPK